MASLVSIDLGPCDRRSPTSVAGVVYLALGELATSWNFAVLILIAPRLCSLVRPDTSTAASTDLTSASQGTMPGINEKMVGGVQSNCPEAWEI